MPFLPPLALHNKFDTIGDNVLLEPIARILAQRSGTDVYVLANLPDVLYGNPIVKTARKESMLPPATRIIDMTDAIRSLEDIGKKQRVIEGKLLRMYEAAGLKQWHITKPELYLTKEEEDRGFELDAILPHNRVGVALESKHCFKNVPYMKLLIKMLSNSGYSVFVFGKSADDKFEWLNAMPVFQIINKPIREAMIYIAMMDYFVGPDTGLMHIAAAMDVKSTVITRAIWKDLYDCYDNVDVLCAKRFSKYSLYTLPVSPRKVLKSIERNIPVPAISISKKQSEIALFRLDGLGGTLTLADQAKKVYEATGVKPDLIVRNYGKIFENNPYINDIVEVGHVVWGECLNEMLERYDTIGEIRFAPGKWYQKKRQWFNQDFSALQGIFDDFPIEHRQFETHGLHHVQVTDLTMGLPYDTIDMEIFVEERYKGNLPDQYIAMSNGVDVQHKGMKQTKTWNSWSYLADILDLPVVQVGTQHDPQILKAIDLRGKTSLLQAFDVLKRAKAVVTTEGGIMHVSYALSVENAFILRGPTRGKLFEYPGQKCIDSYICDICWSSKADWYMNCPKGVDAVCMRSITPERVAYNLKEVL